MTGPTIDLDQLDFAKGGGVVTVVAQDVRTGAVLMVANADRDALERTVATGEMHYRSRTRGLWRKGATSGNSQRVAALAPDCDGDAVLALVDSAGPACHTGRTTCFGDLPVAVGSLAQLDRTVADRALGRSTGTGYTERLLGDRNLRLKKLGEETAELVLALGDGDRGQAVEEAADLVYHLVVALRGVGAGWTDVEAALAARMGPADDPPRRHDDRRR